MKANMELAAENSHNKKISYSIKRLLAQLFKQNKHAKAIEENTQNAKKCDSLESLESLENLRNSDIESECSSLEAEENDANERLSISQELEDFEFADITSVPVRFVRTEHGTFFWTAAAEVSPDNDLIEPLYCHTSNHIAVPQSLDRWAQA